ncbi:MAG: hypothetical protein KAI47_04890 [Deltaproteobacteria bacterium]|nr:hypothetical protein [Deltaproteobacteria bacterium]
MRPFELSLYPGGVLHLARSTVRIRKYVTLGALLLGFTTASCTRSGYPITTKDVSLQDAAPHDLRHDHPPTSDTLRRDVGDGSGLPRDLLQGELPIKDLASPDGNAPDGVAVDLPAGDTTSPSDIATPDALGGPFLTVSVTRKSDVLCTASDADTDCIGTLVIHIEDSTKKVVRETFWHDEDLSTNRTVQITYGGLPVGEKLTYGAALFETSPTTAPFPNPAKNDLIPETKTTASITFGSASESKTTHFALIRCSVGDGDAPWGPPPLVLLLGFLGLGQAALRQRRGHRQQSRSLPPSR